MQASIAACDPEDVAVRVLTRVLGHYPKSNMLLVDMGWTAQGGGQGKEAGYGSFPDNPDLAVAVLKQEAGEVTSADGSPIDFARYPVGSLLHFAPFHSCASGHCHPTLKVVQNGQVVDELEVAKGW